MPVNYEIEEVLEKQKELYFHFAKNIFYGDVMLPDGDSYEIVVDLKPYPKFFPLVTETGGRIPVKMDRHMYPVSSCCCFTTRAKSQILLKTKVKSLSQFFDLILVPFFENNSFYEIKGFYFGEEYSHGKNGIIEGYMDILKIDDTLLTAKAIIQATKNKPLKVHQNCYCGSGRRLRKCANGRHINCFRQLYLVDKEVLLADLSYFENAVDDDLANKQIE